VSVEHYVTTSGDPVEVRLRKGDHGHRTWILRADRRVLDQLHAMFRLPPVLSTGELWLNTDDWSSLVNRKWYFAGRENYPLRRANPPEYTWERAERFKGVAAGIEAARTSLAGLALGRDFGESPDAFFARKPAARAQYEAAHAYLERHTRRNPPAGFKPTKGEYWDAKSKGGKSTLTVTETRRTVYPTRETNPLVKGSSRKAIATNIARLVHVEGRPHKQAVAIALSVARRSKRRNPGARYVVLGSDHVLAALQALPGVSVSHAAEWSDGEDTFTCRRGDRWCVVIHRLYGMSAAEAFDDADADWTKYVEWGDDMDARKVAAFVKRALR
jgi:hypothetical protein